MKKIVSFLLATVLTVSIVFANVPVALADELSPAEIIQVNYQQTEVSASTAETQNGSVQNATLPAQNASSSDQTNPQNNAQSNAQGTVPNGSTDALSNDLQNSTQDNTEPGSQNDASGGVSTDQATLPPGTDSTLQTNACTDSLSEPPVASSATILDTELITDEPIDQTRLDWDKIEAMIALGLALEDLYKTICNATGPSIERIDEGLLSEENPQAHFEEGVYYSGVVNLVNRINDLLEECDLPNGLYVKSLPMSVVDETPEGFCFGHNTLTIVDYRILDWDKELDEPEATTRAYEVTLQLNTGVSYIDRWLAKKGIHGFAPKTFVIEIELKRGDGTVTPPVDPPVGPPVIDTDPVIPQAPTDNPPLVSTYTPAVYAVEVAVTEEALAVPSIVPEEQTLPENEGDVAEDEEITVEGQQIPMASMMVNDDGSPIIVNITLVVMSLLLSAASIAALRQRKPDAPQITEAGSATHPSSTAFSIMGIGLGALSVTLLILSQYVMDGPLNSSVAWTPVLVTISIVQIACLAALFVSRRIGAAKNKKPRINIRY